MKAKISLVIKHTYEIEIDVTDYSDDMSAESQAIWLMSVKEDTDTLHEICKGYASPYTTIDSTLKVLKGDQ